eukprot:gb/GECH01014932.1/.p1 GENE.gb/GECH01014932.1/~~gb/GECH01014932.1/.p1  ORF type:complete len:535 (+),score=143.38 gb/GECH01014932.1/:1-1605(+)
MNQSLFKSASIFLFFFFFIAVQVSTALEVTVFLDSNNDFIVKEVLNKQHGVAWAIWNDTIYTNGWAQLWVGTNSKYSDETQMSAAGIAEGYASQDRIYQMWTNYYANEYGPQGPSSKLREFMSRQMKWTQKQSHSRKHTDPLWYHTDLLMHQFHGLVQGYNIAAPEKQSLKEWELYFLTSAGDLETLNKVFSSKENGNDDLVGNESPPLQDLLTDCSALIKIVDDDIYFAHATWRNYYAMLRVYKVYQFQLHHSSTKSNSVALSSSPGFLSSKDDFYMTSAGLGVMETTNSIFNTSLYSSIQPESLFVWQRAVVANRMASNGSDWTEYFQRYNSGTYNNQWMVLTYPLFDGTRPLRPNTFWILEQIPGFTRQADMSHQLSKTSFWSSYNIPYFKDIYRQSGYVEKFKKYGNKYSYQHCPRANIFRRNQTMIDSFEHMKQMMRYNNWQEDPLSQGEANNAVASRYDLSKDNFAPFGAVDAKVTSASRIKHLQSDAICGPTHQEQNVFEWKNRWPSLSRMGVPERFDFEWIETNAS